MRSTDILEWPELMSGETSEPFDECLACAKPLPVDASEYFVERHFRRVHALDLEEVIFEFAICPGCAAEEQQRMSKESSARIREYVEVRLQHPSSENASMDPLEHCLFSGRPIRECTGYSYHGHVRNGNVQRSIFPFAMSDAATDEISELLSQETTDAQQDFMQRHFNGPPEMAELLNSKRLIFL